MAKFCCSIELEPRTLKQGQLDRAREVAAVDIVQKKDANEASSKFVEEVKPVSEITEMPAVLVVQETNKQEKEEYCPIDKETNINKGKGTPPCQCSFNSSSPIVDSPDQSEFKESLSAPF